MTLQQTLTNALGAATAAPITLTLAALATVLHALGAFDALVLDQSALASGQAWRAATGHLVHLDRAHFLTNVIGLLALGIPLERMIGARRFVALVGLSGLAITGGVLLDPSIRFYSGLSGVLNALFAALCLTNLRHGSRWLWGTLLFAGLAKIGWEWVDQPLISDALIWPPHILSHAIGFAIGLLLSGWRGAARPQADSSHMPAYL